MTHPYRTLLKWLAIGGVAGWAMLGMIAAGLASPERLATVEDPASGLLVAAAVSSWTGPLLTLGITATVGWLVASVVEELSGTVLAAIKPGQPPRPGTESRRPA